MTDDDLGRRLQAALAPPTELRVRPGAVARLRERGRAARRRRAWASAAAAAVAVLGLVVVPQLAGAPGAAPAPPPANSPAPPPADPGPRPRLTDPGPLGSPLEIRPVVAAWTAPTCSGRDPRGPVVPHRGTCLVLGRPLVTVRAVDSLSWSRLDTSQPQWEAYVELTPADAVPVRRHAAGHRGSRIGFVMGGRPIPWATPANDAADRTLHIVFVNREEFTAFTAAVSRGLNLPGRSGGG